MTLHLILVFTSPPPPPTKNSTPHKSVQIIGRCLTALFFPILGRLRKSVLEKILQQLDTQNPSFLIYELSTQTVHEFSLIHADDEGP